MLTSLPALAGPPAWVHARPASPEYFIGIGTADKTRAANPAQAARDKALASLAAEIEVEMRSQTRRQVQEGVRGWSEDYSSELRAGSHAVLEGHERVAEWENERACWAYYRLSKRLYQEKKSARRKAALETAWRQYQDAGTLLERNMPRAALRALFQALLQLREFRLEPLRLSGTRDSTLVFPMLAEAIESVTREVRVRALPASLRLSPFRGGKDSLVFWVEYGGRQAAEPWPMRVGAAGTGDWAAPSTTDSLGRLVCRVRRVDSPDRRLQLRASLDWILALGIAESELPPGLLPAAPAGEAQVEAVAWSFWIKAKGEAAGFKPDFAQSLRSQGYTSEPDSTKADIRIYLDAQAKPYGCNNKFCFSSVDCSVLALARGREVFSTLLPVRGGHLDSARARLKALEIANREMKTQGVTLLVQSLAKLEPPP